MIGSLDIEISSKESDEINQSLDELKSEVNQNQNGDKNFDNWETIENYIEPQAIIDAMFTYFEKKVSFLGLLNSETKNKISKELKSYFSKHHLLVVWNDGKVKLLVDDATKRDFIVTSKNIVSIIKNEVINSNLIKSALRIWWKYKKVMDSIDKSYSYLDNLDKNLYNMSSKKYMDIMFGHVWWIIKEILLENNLWNMTIGEFFGYISRSYPNKNDKPINWIISTTRKKWGQKIIKDEFITDATWVGFD